MLYQLIEENSHLYKESLLEAISINLDINAQDFFSLINRFHRHCNKSQPLSIENCLNLAPAPNTTTAEQCNATMIRDRLVCQNISSELLFLHRT